MQTIPNTATGGNDPQTAVSGPPTFPSDHLHNSYDPERWRHFPEKPNYIKGVDPIGWPPGFIGYIAKYLYSYSASPVPEYAIATAIAFFAGICGRGWIYSGTGLNHDFIVLGESGTGKNVAHQGIANIEKHLSHTPIGLFMVHKRMASPQALLKTVAENPCFLQLIGEVGKMYRAYAKSKHGDNMDELFTAKLDLWERSGPDGAAVGILYSDSAKNVETSGVTSIAHSTLGESTPAVFYGALSTDMMNDGLLSRLWIIEYEGEDPQFNENRVEEMPPAWIAYLSELVRGAASRGAQQPVGHMPEAHALIREFGDQCRDEKLNAGKDPARRQLWVRAYEKVIRLSALLAVADNHMSPVIGVAHVSWAIGLLLGTNLNIQKRVCDGDISDDADHTREQMIMDRTRRWFQEQRKDAKEEGLRTNGLITRRFLQQEVASKEAFAKHRLGATSVFNLTMKNLVDSGRYMEVDKNKLHDMHGVRGQCWRVLDAG